METKMQELGKRNTYTPIDASQVCSPVVLSLNKEETLGEQDLKTSPNNLDVNLRQQTDGLKVKVFVLNKNKKPLMPCTPAKARHLLQQNKAKVVTCKPFTIQLLFDCENVTQEISLGIDAGSKTIGYSATTTKKELISGELEIRQDVSKKISERAMYRRNRRNKLWYRKPKFLNRTKSKYKGWLAPSIKHKLDTHIRLIEKIKTLLPITKTIVEVAQFDTQKLKNSDINGVRYQQGQMSGYDNLRAFILSRDKYTCQLCKKKEGIFDIHHIIQRKDGGGNRPDNLVALHIKCHKDFHSGKIKHTFIKPKSYKETAVMNNVWSRVVDVIGAEKTFGYITKRKRIELGLSKTHYNDAFVISEGNNQKRTKPIFCKQVRRNNRCLQLNRKGFKPSIRRKKYSLKPKDIVMFNNIKYSVKGVFNYGTYVRLIDNFDNIINTNFKNVRLKYYGNSIL